MSETKVYHAAVALIRSNGKVISKMKNVRLTENFTRLSVQGIGTIYDSEKPITKFTGTLSASKMSTSFKDGVIPNAIRRVWTNIRSQVLAGESSMEDQLVLEDGGVVLELYEKVTDVIDSTGTIRPKLQPYGVVRNFLVESASLDLSEGAIAGEDVSGSYLEPIAFTS